MTESLEEIIDRSTRICRDMTERGGPQTKWDVEKVKKIVKDYEDYKPKGLMERYLIWSSLRALRQILGEIESQGIGEENGNDK